MPLGWNRADARRKNNTTPRPGFFRGAGLADPARLLRGSAKLMRHVKLMPGVPANPVALHQLIEAAYADIKAIVEHG